MRARSKWKAARATHSSSWQATDKWIRAISPRSSFPSRAATRITSKATASLRAARSAKCHARVTSAVAFLRAHAPRARDRNRRQPMWLHRDLARRVRTPRPRVALAALRLPERSPRDARSKTHRHRGGPRARALSARAKQARRASRPDDRHRHFARMDSTTPGVATTRAPY